MNDPISNRLKMQQKVATLKSLYENFKQYSNYKYRLGRVDTYYSDNSEKYRKEYNAAVEEYSRCLEKEKQYIKCDEKYPLFYYIYENEQNLYKSIEFYAIEGNNYAISLLPIYQKRLEETKNNFVNCLIEINKKLTKN